MNATEKFAVMLGQEIGCLVTVSGCQKSRKPSDVCVGCRLQRFPAHSIKMALRHYVGPRLAKGKEMLA